MPSESDQSADVRDAPTATVAQGRLGGRVDRDIDVFVGVPYAAPPVGPLRFAAPQPPASWDGVREAVTPGATAPQLSMSYPQIDLAPLAGEGWVRGDDYLTLNVWAPRRTKARPVMVWIHGGGGTVGNKDTAVSDGSGFARSGVVCVAINYRLGIEGFLPVQGAPTNLALRDMIAALAWVKDNIAAFGGDPANITVFGESAGAFNLSSVLASPMSEGLFQRAILQSGHGSTVLPVEITRRTTRKVAEILGITPDADGFRSVSPERLLEAQTKIMRPGAVDLRDETGFDPGWGLGRFSAVYGDDVLPLHPLQALRNGAARDVDLLIGTTLEEGNFWFIPTRLQWVLPGFAARWLLGKVIPRADEILKAYGLGRRGRGGGAVLNLAFTDLSLRWPARQFAAAHQGRTHVFEFDWRSDACGGKLGAAHGVDLPFVFDTLAVASGPRGIAGRRPPQAFATRVHALWVAYATTGALPWKAFDAETRRVRWLYADETVMEPVMPAAEFLPS